MHISSYVKTGFISLFLFNIPLFSADEKSENQKDSFTRLAGFVSRGNIEIINKLITDTNKNLQADNGLSLLHFAVLIEDSKKRLATVECLLSHKVAVNLIQARVTPLDIAELSGDESLLEMIKKAGGKKYQELPSDSAPKKKALVRDFIQEFEDETGVSELTQKLIASAKTEQDAITLCKQYIKERSMGSKSNKAIYQDCARDALGTWSRKTGKHKVSSMALYGSDSE